jgi:hypothetical protein
LVARLVRSPVAYLRSRKLKKYHSFVLSFATSGGGGGARARTYTNTHHQISNKEIQIIM